MESFDLPQLAAERDEAMGLSAHINAAIEQLRESELRAVAEVDLPAGWVWERRVECVREPNLWLLRSTLTPVKVD